MTSTVSLLDLSSSQEMYLKTIHLLCEENKVARVKDIAAQLNVTMSSVNGAIKGLTSRGFCEHSRYGYVDLTEDGRAAALQVLGKYQVLARFLHEILGVERKIADNDACEMEHIVSPQTLDRIETFLDFIDGCGKDATQWLEHYRGFLTKRLNGERCEECEL
jgi:DtxR family transcriptional regulator, Mn-dependent transcriptional regulator